MQQATINILLQKLTDELELNGITEHDPERLSNAVNGCRIILGAGGRGPNPHIAAGLDAAIAAKDGSGDDGREVGPVAPDPPPAPSASSNASGEIAKLREQLFVEAEVAAEMRDLARLSKAQQNLAKFDALLQQLKAIQPHSAPGEPPASHPSNHHRLVTSPVPMESNRARGEHARADWISTNLASALTPLRGALYRKTNDDTLGIAYGEEKKGRQGRWFLGLPAGKFDCAVLLCRPLTGNLFWINLPNDFIAKHNPQLSKSNVGQVKFNVFKHGHDYYLRVPHTGNIPVTDYLNRVA